MKSTEKYSDDELILGIIQDDPDCLATLYCRYHKKIYYKCYSIVKNHDDAFDLAEDVFLKVWNNLQHFRRYSSFATWLYVIVHRHCLEFLRKQKRKHIISLTNEQDGYFFLDEVEDLEETLERKNIMINLINQLPDDEKALLMLKYNKREPIDKLKSIYNLSVSALKMRLKRSRDRLNNKYLKAINS